MPVREIAGRRMCRRATGRRSAERGDRADDEDDQRADRAGAEQRRRRPRRRPRARRARGRRARASAPRRPPSATAISTQRSQPTACRVDDRLSRRDRAPRQPRAGRRGARRRVRIAALAVDEHRAHARPRCAPSMSSSSVSPTITASSGVDVEQLEHPPEDRLVRLRLPVRARGEHRVDAQAVMRDERVEVARGVREQADLQPARAQRLERRQRVVVQLEVVRVAPSAPSISTAAPYVSPLAAHPFDDPLR